MVLAIIPIMNNNIVVTNLIAELWEHGDIPKKRSDGRNMSSDKQVETGRKRDVLYNNILGGITAGLHQRQRLPFEAV